MAHYTEKFREEIKDQLPNDSKIAERFLADMDANISDFMDEFGEDKVTYLILVKRYGYPEQIVANFMEACSQDLLREQVELCQQKINELEATVSSSKRFRRNTFVAAVAACAVWAVSIFGAAQYYQVQQTNSPAASNMIGVGVDYMPAYTVTTIE